MYTKVINKTAILLLITVLGVSLFSLPSFSEPTYVYYGSGYMYTKTLDDGTVYEYTDENYLGDGYGMLVKETRPDLTYKTFNSYYSGTRQARFVSEYDASDNFIVTYEYDASGNFIGKTENDGTIYVFYPISGRMASKTLPDGTLFEYTDENYLSEGYGLLTKETRPDNTYKTFTDYYALTRQYRYVKEYDALDNLVVIYEYDSSGNFIGKTEADGTIYTFYLSGLMETKTLPDGTIYEYSNENWNSQGYGVLTKETRPDSTYKTFSSYFPATNQAQYVSEYDAADTLLVTYEYDSSGTLVDQTNFDGTIYTYYPSGLMETKTLPDGTVYEYTNENYMSEGYGLLIKETASDGSYKTFSSYYTGTRQPQLISEYDTAGTFIVTYEFNSTGTLIGKTDTSAKYVYYPISGRMRTKELLIAVGGPIGTIYEYSNEAVHNVGTTGEYGYFVKQTNPDGSYKFFADYWSADQPRYIWEYNSAGVLTASYEYDASGILIASSDASTNITYYGDTGLIESKIMTSPDASGNVYYHYENNDFNSQGYGRVDEMQRSVPNSSGELEYTVTYPDPASDAARTVRSYSDFIKGTNLPWGTYGYDIGVATLGSEAGQHMGFSSAAGFNDLVSNIKGESGDYVRVFLFNDLRSGINFDASGNPISFTASVYEDMDVLIDVAEAKGLKLIPVLLDFTIADGVSVEGSTQVGEYPDLITDPAKRAMLIGLLGDFVNQFSGNDTIFAWEVMNEPEEIIYNTPGINAADMQTFISELVTEVKTEDASTLVTLGSQDRTALLNYWTGTNFGSVDVGLTLYQFHYYNYMETVGKDLDYDATLLGLGNPVIVGEIDPTQDADNAMTITQKLQVLYDNGYAGGLFWEDDTALYTLDTADQQEIQNWGDNVIADYEYDVSGILVNVINYISSETYTYYASGLMHTKTIADGTVYEYSNENWNSQGYGVLIKETRPDNTYKTFSDYYPATNQPRYVKEYNAAGTLLVTYEYDAAGNLVGITDTSAIYTYYTLSGRMNTKELLVASGGDAIGTIYTYSDDALTHADGTSGYGYLTQKTLPDTSFITYTNHWSADQPR
ncbi:MAG: hypothetical protein ABIG55_01465, partial [Candidatus Omnitrophota bacterium]